MDPLGSLSHSNWDLQPAGTVWLRRDFRLSVHANSDRTVDQSLEMYKKILTANLDYELENLRN